VAWPSDVRKWIRWYEYEQERAAADEVMPDEEAA
jgi:hypothetical protein